MSTPLKDIPFNLNDTVRVKLNDFGLAIMRHEHELFQERYTPKAQQTPFCPPETDPKGFSRWQLWRLMQTFGEHLAHGSTQPFATGIILEVRT